MPIYLYSCSTCGTILERVQNLNEEAPLCCGERMAKLPTFPTVVKIQGEGGYPSRRKFCNGSAPYTTGDTKPWLDSNPSKPNWLSSDARKRQVGVDEIKHLVST